MPTQGPTQTHRPGARTNHRQAGFTLLEVLVVLVIFGVLVAGLNLTLSPNTPEIEVRDQLDRVAALFEHTRNTAVLTGELYAWQLQHGGYRFLTLTDDGWTPMTDNAIWRPRTLPDWVQAELWVEGEPADLAASTPVPQVLFVPSGEMSAFELRLRHPFDGTSGTLTGTALGQLQGPTLEVAPR